MRPSFPASPNRRSKPCRPFRRRGIASLGSESPRRCFSAPTRGRPPKIRSRRGLRIFRPVFVSRQLPFDERVERQVGIERADHEITVVVHSGPVGIRLVSVAFGVSGHVEPMPRLPLAEMLVGQQLLDEFFVPIGRRVGKDCVEFLRCRREPDQIKIESADQRLPRASGADLASWTSCRRG